MEFNVLHTEWSDGWGGQEIRILLDAQGLKACGHRVTLLCRPQSGLAWAARRAGLPVILQRIRHAFDLAALWRLRALVKEKGFDVVHTHSSVDSWVASAAARLAGVPVLVRTRHLSVPISTHPLNFVYRWPDGIVTTAEAIRRRMIEVNGLDPDRVVSIPTGVDLTLFGPGLDPGDIRAELGLEPQHRVVSMVAVLRSWKRHELFLEAAAQLASSRPELRFLIVGEGPRREHVEAEVRDLGLEERVILTGHREDIPQILAVSEVCVLTSESSEGVPQSVLQSQAMARPVVACAAGGIPEVVADGQTGLLCPVNDAAAVARAIGRLLDDPDLARRLGRKARAQVEERFSLEAMVRATLNLYERIYRAKTARPA